MIPLTSETAVGERLALRVSGEMTPVVEVLLTATTLQATKCLQLRYTPAKQRSIKMPGYGVQFVGHHAPTSGSRCGSSADDELTSHK
jgi:hypothetical protein